MRHACYTFWMSYSIRRPLSEAERSPLARFSPYLAHLLFHRGVIDDSSAEAFVSPQYDGGTHDPFLLKDAEKSAIRIIQAIESNKSGDHGEKIAIYSDYDADGIPGAALFYDFFRRIGFTNFVIYIPHRHNEGFGVNIDAVEELAAQGVQLMITIDCGITDVLPIARARELGIEVIITDHHEPPAELPPAIAIIDHKQKDCPYPDKNLCGSGVAYKLIQAILKKDRLGLPEGHEKWLLDLVGMATLSDMVPLVGENRVLAHYGLTVMRKTQRKGLTTLLNKLKINQKYLSEDDIAFMITPRINAASRMGAPQDAFALLTAETEDDARVAADHLDRINNERKGIVASLVKEVKKTVRDRHGESIPSVIVLGNPDWRPSLLGLAANSCAQEFDRPVFLWGRDGDDLIKGSCRSEGRTSVVELMRAVPIDVFTQYGGHTHSGGFAVSNEKIHFLEQHLVKAGESEIARKSAASKAAGDSEGAHTGDYTIDLELRLDEVTAELFDAINKLAPFGVGNPKPVLLFRNVQPKAVRRFGKAKEHIELSFDRTRGGALSAISFFGGENAWAAPLESAKPGSAKIDLIASLEKSFFKGRPELRLRVVDVVMRS